MQGKVVVITGATSGIGQVASEKLATMGARMVLVGRDPERGEAALARLKHIAPQRLHTIHYGDLSRLSEMKRVSAEIAMAEPRVDVLINNAGALFNTRQITEDGFELTFATNHLSYFVIAHGLRERLAASAPARIVNTSSNAHRRARVDFDDLQSARDFRGFMVYSRSKLLNILFTRELARRLSGKGVTANSLHPGFVATRFGDQSGGWFSYLVRFWKNFAITPEEGAATIVYLASSPEVAIVTGQYFFKCRPATPTSAAQDDEAAKRLWTETQKLTGLTWT